MRLVLHFDGGGASVSGPASFGCVLAWEDGEVLEAFGGTLNGTVNEAEYAGLVAGLQAALKYAPLEAFTVRGDSQLVVKQVRGEFRCRKPHLQAWLEQARGLLALLPGTVVEWVPRTQNTAADALATEHLNAA